MDTSQARIGGTEQGHWRQVEGSGHLLVVRGELAGVAEVDLQGVLLLPEGLLVGRLLRLQLLLRRLRRVRCRV